MYVADYENLFLVTFLATRCLATTSADLRLLSACLEDEVEDGAASEVATAAAEVAARMPASVSTRATRTS